MTTINPNVSKWPKLDKLLNSHNWEEWSMRVQQVLRMNGAYGLLTTADSTCDSQVVAWLSWNCEPVFARKIQPLATVKAAYQLLEDEFSANATSRLTQLYSRLNGVKLEANESVSAFMDRADNIFMQIRTLQPGHSEYQVITQVLQLLPPSYDNTVQHIHTVMGSAATFDKVKPLVRVREELLKAKEPSSATAMTAFGQGRGRGEQAGDRGRGCRRGLRLR